MVKFLQGNINHCWLAHDLLAQQRLELGIGICIIAEPVHVPNSPFWMSSEDGKAAISWDPDRTSLYPCSPVTRGRGFVVARYREVNVVSCYVSPNTGVNGLLTFLDELGDALQDLGRRKIIVCGDFNCKSSA